MLGFTIRDVLWLTMVAALAVASWFKPECGISSTAVAPDQR
jgi:hypothetical protein